MQGLVTPVRMATVGTDSEFAMCLPSLLFKSNEGLHTVRNMMRECSERGCRTLVVSGRCEKCLSGDNEKKKRERIAKQLRSLYDPYAALYDTARWKRLRIKVLIDNPFCVICQYGISNQVDHKIPARIYCKDDPEKFFDRANLCGLCRVCHGVKSRQEQAAGLTAQTSPTPNK